MARKKASDLVNKANAYSFEVQIANALDYGKQQRTLYLDALKREVRMVPNLDNNGFVSLGRSSSDLSKNEMSDLLSLIYEFGARHGVVFNDQQSEGQAA